MSARPAEGRNHGITLQSSSRAIVATHMFLSIIRPKAV